MRRKTTTIRDVAVRAGVSVSAVSHVLNGNDQHVGSAVRQRVLDVVEELNYRPNAIARSMARRKTATIGLVISEIDNPFFVPVIEGVYAVLQPAGYHMVLASAPDLDSEVEAIETLRAQQVDGFVFMALTYAYPIEHLVRLKEDDVPFVIINRFVDDPEINQILMDDYKAGYVATSHLLDLGHTHVGTICGPIHNHPPRRSSIERLQGWRQALEERDLFVNDAWIAESDFTYKGGYEACQRLLERIRMSGEATRPTALFVASELMAVGVLKALHEAGLRVPQDIALISTGDPPFAAYTIPALSTLAHPVPEAGRIAAHILLEWLTEGRPAQAQRITLGVTLMVRESCGGSLSTIDGTP